MAYSFNNRGTNKYDEPVSTSIAPKHPLSVTPKVQKKNGSCKLQFYIYIILLRKPKEITYGH